MNFFKDLFKKKSEEAMQRRADQSRKEQSVIENEELENKFNETHYNLDVLLDEIRNKKNGTNNE